MVNVNYGHISWGLFGDGCIGLISMDKMVARPIVKRSMRNILILKYWIRESKIFRSC